MLLTKYLKIKMNRGNLGYYNKVMNTKFKIGDIIEIPVELLSKRIPDLVEVSCDVCKSESTIKYSNYNSCLGYGFYSCNKCKHIKRKLTNISKYGVENYINIEKRKETMISKYGFYNNNREKSKITCIDKYGEDNVSKVDSVKESKKKTNNKNWGVDNVFQSEKIKEISKLKMLYKFGVEHPNQNINIFNKAQISGFKIHEYNGILYRGKYELDFLKHCEENKIDVKNGPSIRFKHNNKNKVYHSDFYIESINLICEIKSKYTYECNKLINDIKKDESINQKYNFIFIIDKNYDEFDKFNPHHLDHHN